MRIALERFPAALTTTADARKNLSTVLNRLHSLTNRPAVALNITEEFGTIFFMWAWPSKKLDRRTVRFHVATCTRVLCWAEVLALWTDSPSFADEFTAALANSQFTCFRWETPALRRQDLDEPFEFVLIDSPDLPENPDPTPFAEHFRRAADRPVIRFDNLGGDAELVVPCPIAEDCAYVHVARFVREAPADQQRALWHEVGLAMERRLDERPVWLSTAGSGVAWLHVRLDDSPKYYVHSPYS